MPGRTIPLYLDERSERLLAKWKAIAPVEEYLRVHLRDLVADVEKSQAEEEKRLAEEKKAREEEERKAGISRF